MPDAPFPHSPLLLRFRRSYPPPGPSASSGTSTRSEVLEKRGNSMEWAVSYQWTNWTDFDVSRGTKVESWYYLKNPITAVLSVWLTSERLCFPSWALSPFSGVSGSLSPWHMIGPQWVLHEMHRSQLGFFPGSDNREKSEFLPISCHLKFSIKL